MPDITSKTIFHFDPLPVAAAVDAGGVAYTTPEPHRYQLGGLGLMDYVRAKLRVAVRLNQATVAGEMTVKLNDGVEDVATIPVTLSGTKDAVVDVDLGRVSATALMRIVADMDVAADVGTEAQVFASLECETPFITSGC